ncbi:MAG TPA: hypothetical protein VL307_16340 [Chitinophagaceae bacterium]|nr:hypothetical protein [Chitinophagaceae bacterium]
MADQFGKYSKDSVRNIAGTDTGYVYGEHFMQKGVNTRVTGGVLLNSFLVPGKSLVLTGGIYYQAGRDIEGKRLKAYTSTLSLTYSKKCFSYIIGWDYLSGNNAFSSSTANHRFDPLYGTPHKLWGNLDYFYVGTGSPAGGLNNPFAKLKYTGSGRRLTTDLAYHYFGLAKQQKDLAGASISKYLGSEVDATAAYALNKITTLEFGISVLAASRSMEYAKEITPGTSRLTATWTYLMITIKPAFLFK